MYLYAIVMNSIIENSILSRSTCKHSIKNYCLLCAQSLKYVTLISELHEVIDWIHLGLHLGIKLPELKTIEANYPTLQRRRIELFEKWQKNVTPTWSAIVQALVKTGMRRLASELTQKHGWLNSE